MRSRFMVTGLDLDRHRVRKFYLGCARQWLAPTELRIAEYAEGKNWPEAILYRPIQSTPQDRMVLMRAMQIWHAKHDLRVYADDLRVIYS